MAPRITIVGGGSTHWTPKLLVDFVNTPSLAGAEVTLVDLDADSLPPMLDVADRLRKERDVALAVQATTDLAAGLEGAEYVITAFSVGGFASMRHDVEIPCRYGIRQPVGDSVGPGGITRALRSIPVLLSIAGEVERRAPDALLVNVSNPLTALCRAVTRETQVRTVGLCNELVGLQFVLSLLFDCALDDVDPVVGGVNHLPLVTALRIRGEDGFAMLSELLSVPPEELDGPLWLTPPEGMHYRRLDPARDWTKGDVVAGNRVKFELFRRFGVLPGSSDTHVVEFFPGFVTEASDSGRDWGIHHYGMAGHREDKAEDDRHLAALLADGPVPMWPSGELVAPLLDGLVTGTRRALPVNLPNTGQVDVLPLGAVVECIGVTGPDGVTPRDATTVPSVLGEYLRRVHTAQELTVDAALSGNRTTVIEAMLADPLAGRLPYEYVLAMTDDLLTATSSWLPAFAS